MKGRKATPNIMDELLHLKVSNPTDLIQDTSTSEHLNAGIPEHQTTNVPVINTNTDSPIKEDKPLLDNKAKATYYISQKLIEDMDQVWFDLRKLLKPEDRGKFSKSLLVELAVKSAVEDFQTNGKNSKLLQEILNLASDKEIS